MEHSHLRGNTLKKTTIAGLAGIFAGFALLIVPSAAHSAEMPVQTSQASAFAAAKSASLTFTGGTVDGIYELTPSEQGHATVGGTSTSAINFVQDDGWNQEAQVWTPGNELELRFLDADLSLGNLAFNEGKVTGTIVGPDGHIRDSMLDLGEQSAHAEVNGAAVTLTFTDTYGSQWIMHFTLEREA
jgi:hypothetical protein